MKKYLITVILSLLTCISYGQVLTKGDALRFVIGSGEEGTYNHVKVQKLYGSGMYGDRRPAGKELDGKKAIVTDTGGNLAECRIPGSGDIIFVSVIGAMQSGEIASDSNPLVSKATSASSGSRNRLMLLADAGWSGSLGYWRGVNRGEINLGIGRQLGRFMMAGVGTGMHIYPAVGAYDVRADVPLYAILRATDWDTRYTWLVDLRGGVYVNAFGGAYASAAAGFAAKVGTFQRVTVSAGPSLARWHDGSYVCWIGARLGVDF